MSCIYAKLRFSRTEAHIFVSPGEAPANITQYVAGMERQFNACQTPRSMYLSIFNSFRVIRCLSQCVSPKIAIITTFLFPLGTPLGQSRYMLYGWKENSLLINCLAARAHLSLTVSEIQRDICEQVRQQDAYLAIRPAYPRGCCLRAAKGDKTYLQPVFLHR